MAIDPVRSLILRWGDGEPPAGAMRALGPRAVLLKNEAELPKRIEDGLWPGVNRATGSRRDADEVASASREPWVNANGFRIHCHRALHPYQPALLDYKPDAKAGLSEGQVVAFDSLELVLADARANGGNAVLTPDQRFKDALKAADTKALAAWNTLAKTAQWFDANAALFGRPPVPIVTAVHDGSHETEEFANMLFRRGGSPRVVAAGSLPKPDPRILVVSAAGLKETTPALLDHARAGATVIIDAKPGDTWKKVKPESDRDFYSLGKGQVLAYREPVLDPSEYALDVIDVATYRRRATRIWNAGAAIPVATEGTSPSETLVIALNYGSKVDQDVQVRVQGLFAKATLLRPEAEPADLKIYKRGAMTEVFLPSLAVVAAIRFLK
ncbi:MAG: hypothetical protein JNK48_25275 [Bryobacterales bacterium]|nr:hypothetical protein [Bryobacterales bacterium]